LAPSARQIITTPKPIFVQQATLFTQAGAPRRRHDNGVDVVVNYTGGDTGRSLGLCGAC